MAKFTVRMDRDEEGMGIKSITFEVPENIYALVGDILTGRLEVKPSENADAPAEAAPAEVVEDAPVEIAPQ